LLIIENKNLPGGGFAIPANRGYFAFFDQLVSEMHKAGKDLAIFAVAYTLIPKASYPTQLRQSVAALRYILQATGRDPANIYLGGDSAGGNLVLGILSHLSHPHPEIKPLHISGKLGGATLMSPWSSLETEFPPEETEPLGDLVTVGTAKPWASGYLNGRDRDYYTDASMAPVEWWDGLQIKEILIVGGGYEILLPFIEDLVEKLKVGGPSFSRDFRGCFEASEASRALLLI
jgi:acetyl esterase/lipase